MRGTPFIMQGEELGLVNVNWSSVDDYQDVSTHNHYKFALSEGYSEEEAMAAVQRFSRDNARTPVQWTDAENAGFLHPGCPGAYRDRFIVRHRTGSEQCIKRFFVNGHCLRFFRTGCHKSAEC